MNKVSLPSSRSNNSESSPAQTQFRQSMLLSEVIARMIDELGIMNRRTWSDHLSVTVASVSQWTTGKNVPRPDKLLAIVNRVRQSGLAEAREALEEFERLANR